LIHNLLEKVLDRKKQIDSMPLMARITCSNKEGLKKTTSHFTAIP